MNIQYQGGANFEKIQTKFFLSTLGDITTEEPIMIELGSNDCHYSILFNNYFKNNCKNICIECSRNLLNLGKSNASSQGCSMHFEHAYIGEMDKDYMNKFTDTFKGLSKNKTSIKAIKEKYSIRKIDILHMDIQGSEIFVMEELVNEKIPVEYIFVSTHESTIFGSTFKKVKEALMLLNYSFLFESPTNGGYGDGLIVAKKI